MKQSLFQYRIKDLNVSERPRERLESQGSQALSTAELLAILLGSGGKGYNAVQIGQHLITRFKGLRGIQQASFSELQNVQGVGPAKAAQIKAAIELGRRLATNKPEDRPMISSPQDVADQVQYEMVALEQEELRVLLLDSRNRLIDEDKLYRGSLNASSVRPAEIFKEGIRKNAAGLIVVHNHPSGDPSPSPEDVHLTRMLIEAGALLELPLLDHVIIGAGRICSIKAIHPELW